MALLWTAVGHGQRESLGQSSGGEGRARPQRRGRACVRSGSALHERGGGAACEHRHGPRQGTHSHARHTGSAGVALAWSRRRPQQRLAQVSAHHRPGAVKTGVADVGSWVVTCRAGPLAKGEAWDVAPGGGGHLTLGGHRRHREWGGGRAGRTAAGRVDVIYPSLSAWVTGCTQRPQWARCSLSGSYSSHREVQNATRLQPAAGWSLWAPQVRGPRGGRVLPPATPRAAQRPVSLLGGGLLLIEHCPQMRWL